MEIKKINLQELKMDNTFNLSYPPRPERFEEWMRKFPELPSLIINDQNIIIFGTDGYDYLRSINAREIQVLQIRLSDKNALFLTYNLKNSFFGCNLFEKLIFLKKIYPISDIGEIQEKADLGFPINQEILEQLESITGTEFRDLLISDRINIKTALKICKFKKKDRQPLIHLFYQTHFSLSNQFRLLDMIQEIAFRDKTTTEQISTKLNLLDMVRTEKSEMNIINKILQHRYPAYQQEEKKWREEVKKLRLPADYRLNHADFFEKKNIQLTISLKNFDALKSLVEKLKK